MPDAPAPQQQDQNSQASGQQQEQTQTLTPEQQRLAREQQAEKDVQAQEHQRILGLMPAFNTTNNENAVPLSPGQKIRLSFRSAVDPWQFGITLVAAGLGQAQNSHPGYGQGLEGYGKRYAASYADLFDGTVIGNGLLPAALHQDPRYFRLGHGSAWHRFLYALSTNVICKGDNGHWQPNISNVGGNIISGEISQYYYPKSERGAGLVFSNAFVVTGEGAFGSELLEFWPDIHRKLFKHREDTYTEAAEEAEKKRNKQAPPAVPSQKVTPAPAKPDPNSPAPAATPQQL